MKKIIPLLITLFFFSACNIYRQMILPTPYYPKEQKGQIIVQDENEQTLNQNEKEVKSQIKPLKQTNIKTKNKTVVQRIPFPEAEYAALAKTGDATVKGVIFVTTSGGKRIYGKETRLYLNPVTSYSTQWYKESYLGGAKMSQVDPRLFNYLRFTTSDETGHFEFLNVPSGSYYLIGVVKCGAECGYVPERTIRIAKKISVIGNEIKDVTLSKELK